MSIVTQAAWTPGALQMHDTRAAARPAQVSVRQAELARHENQPMRKIAAWAAMLAVPTKAAESAHYPPGDTGG